MDYNGMETAKSVLRRELSNLKKRVGEIETALSALSQLDGDTHQSPIVVDELPPVRPGQYKGMRVGMALEAYFKREAGTSHSSRKGSRGFFQGRIAIPPSQRSYLSHARAAPEDQRAPTQENSRVGRRLEYVAGAYCYGATQAAVEGQETLAVLFAS